MIRVERGRIAITKVDLNALNRGARERGWWSKYVDDVSLTYLDYVGLQAGSAFIGQFQYVFVPGLLQTADYAEAGTGTVAAAGPLELVAVPSASMKVTEAAPDASSPRP